PRSARAAHSFLHHALPISPLDELVIPVKIELERMSGGYDEDGKAGDDGIVLYIQPMDKDGSVLKVAGTIKVTLYDLQNPPEQHRSEEHTSELQSRENLVCR